MNDICSIIIQKLKTEPTISSLVDRIKMESQPETVSDKLITVRAEWEGSEPIWAAQTGVIYINVYVKESVDEPYKTLRDISYKVKEFLNRLNEDLTTGDVTVYQILKTFVRDFYEEDTQLWRSLISFDIVLSEKLQE